MRASRRLRLAVAGGLLAGALGCGGPAQTRYERRLERTPEPAAHAVHSQRLGQLMRGLERLRDQRLPQAMDVPTAEARWATGISEVATALVASAGEIPEAAADADLDAEERREFRGLAERLGRQSQELADAVPELDAPALRARVDAIEATCDACHRRFRIPGDPRADD